MAIFHGPNEITAGNLKIGGTDIAEAYYGATKIWPDGTTPGPLDNIKADMVAWYDCAQGDVEDLENKHSPGNGDATINPTPEYSDGFFISTPANGAEYKPGNVGQWLPLNFNATNQDGTFALRWRPTTGFLNGDHIISKGARDHMEISAGLTGNSTYRLGVPHVHDSQYVVGQIYCIFVRYTQTDATTGICDARRDTEDLGGSSGTWQEDLSGNTLLPRVNRNRHDFDWFACWNRLLTDAECDALYNSGNTTEYASLPDL